MPSAESINLPNAVSYKLVSGLIALIAEIGTLVKLIITTITPTINSEVTRTRFVHLITSGPPSAISVPSTTQPTPSIGFQIFASSANPNPFTRLIIELANKFASTAYQPKFAKLITTARIATPLMPRTERNQIHRSIPYRTANNTGKHEINTHTILKQKILINICLNPRYCATYAPCV